MWTSPCRGLLQASGESWTVLKFPFQCVPLNPLPHRVPTLDGEEVPDSELRDTQAAIPVPAQTGKMHHPNSQSKLP